jgi:hypothetical protein
LQCFYTRIAFWHKLASSQPKGSVMAKLVIEKAETLFERFERSLEKLAEKIL